MTSTTMTPEMSALKTRLKSTWESGDYGVFANFYIEYYGPTNRAYRSLDAAGQKAMHDDLTTLWTTNNVATDGSTHVLSEYLEVIGTRA